MAEQFLWTVCIGQGGVTEKGKRKQASRRTKGYPSGGLFCNNPNLSEPLLFTPRPVKVPLTAEKLPQKCIA